MVVSPVTTIIAIAIAIAIGGGGGGIMLVLVNRVVTMVTLVVITTTTIFFFKNMVPNTMANRMAITGWGVTQPTAFEHADPADVGR